MFEPGDNLNRDFEDSSKHRPADSDLEQNFDKIDVNLSAKNVAIRKKQLEQLFIRLITFGLAFGTALGIITYYLMDRFGLNKKPYQIEQEKIEQEKQQQAFFPEITVFPTINES